MRYWKIVRWSGMQLEQVTVQATDAANALGQIPMGMYDMQVISVVEVPYDPMAT